MNETIRILKERRSVRSYSNKQVDKDYLDVILEAGMYAPTGKGAQSPIMVVVRERELIRKLSSMNAKVLGVTDHDPFFGAPTVIIVFADKNRPTYIEDGSLVMGNLMNAAYSIGIDSCWINRAKEVFESEEGQELMKKWGIENKYVGIGHCVLGYGDVEYPIAKPRKEGYVIHVNS